MNLVWFRSDLRVRDNMALEAAMEAASEERPVAAIYIATPRQWQAHDDAPIKLDFWRRNLAELETSLAQINIPLHYIEVPDYGDVAGVIKEAVEKWQLDALYFNAEYPLNESRRDAMVLAQADELAVRTEVHHDQVLLQPGSVLNQSGNPFKVFTPFSKKCRAMIHVPGRAKRLSAPAFSAGKLQRLNGQKALDEINWPGQNKAWTRLWPAGEKHAGKILNNYCRSGIRDYKLRRDFPAVDGTSTLSPWLTAGVISTRDCWRKAVSSHHGEGPETWKNELLWREFYKHILFHYPRVSMGKPFRQDLDFLAWRHDDDDYRAWCEGRTGIPIVDAAMRQLNETGWMHNRLRMITAMFLSKHLLIDWRLGEKWFMQHLVDGDFSANNGGWQWSASTGTDAAPYFRVFNPVTQSRRFDEEGQFLRRFLPELADLDDKSIHDPGLLKPDDYPAPIVDLKFGRERAISAFKS